MPSGKIKGSSGMVQEALAVCPECGKNEWKEFVQKCDCSTQSKNKYTIRRLVRQCKHCGGTQAIIPAGFSEFIDRQFEGPSKKAP